MTARRPLTLVSGTVQEIPAGDTLTSSVVDLSAQQLAPAVLLSSGEEVISREVVSANTATVSGRVQLTYFTARKSETTTQTKMYTGATAAGATPSLCRIGLYSIDGSGNGTLVAAVANDTTLFGSTNSGFTRSWSSSYSKVAGQMYALGIIVISAAAMPTLASIAGAANAAAMWSTDRRLTANINSQTDLPSSFVPGSLTTSGVRFYGEILP